MANFLLVSYAGYPYSPSSLCPDNGLALLAAVLQGEGHSVRILDFGTVDTMRRLYPPELSRRAAPLLMELSQAGAAAGPALLQELAATNKALELHQQEEVRAVAEEVCREVAALEPAFVGFKLWNGDGFWGSIAIAEELRRRHPKVKLFAGGPHATWAGAMVHERTDAFDAVVVGEAEDKILALAEHALRGVPVRGLPGIITSAEDRTTPTDRVNLDDLPQPVYDEACYPALQGDQKLKLFVVDDSRGCPFRCAFCVHPYESGTRTRTRSPRRIVDQIEAMVRPSSGVPGSRSFRFAGSSTPGSLMAEVAAEILTRGLGGAEGSLRYASFGHFASSSPDHFEVMYRSGLRALFFGLETGSEQIMRQAVGQPGKLRKVRETIEAAKAAGIFVACSMIVPMPFETEETFQESVRLILELRPDAVPVQFPGLLPGTLWFEHPERYGFEVDKERYLREQIDYKIRLLFPPTFWDPLPYKLNGMNFREFTAWTARFAAVLEEHGILTNVPDDNALMAQMVGMSAREFRDRARIWCATGDAEAMQDLVRRYNAAAATPQP